MNASNELSWDIIRTGKILIGTKEDTLVIRVTERNENGEEAMVDQLLILSRIKAGQLLKGLTLTLRQNKGRSTKIKKNAN